MHFRAPHRNIAITMLLTTSISADGSPDSTTDNSDDGTVGTAFTTATAGNSGGSGSQAEEPVDPDGVPNLEDR